MLQGSFSFLRPEGGLDNTVGAAPVAIKAGPPRAVPGVDGVGEAWKGDTWRAPVKSAGISGMLAPTYHRPQHREVISPLSLDDASHQWLLELITQLIESLMCSRLPGSEHGRNPEPPAGRWQCG